MNMSAKSVKYWTQMSLIPPPVVELVLRVGVMDDDGHAQAQLEVWDGSTGDLISMVSRPHFDPQTYALELASLCSELTELVEMYISPFG